MTHQSILSGYFRRKCLENVRIFRRCQC